VLRLIWRSWQAIYPMYENGYRFINFPSRAPMSLYDDVRSEVVRRAKLVDEVCSVYEIGSVSVPGISDLDFLLVFDSVPNCNLNDLFAVRSFPVEMQRVLLHPPFIVHKDNVHALARHFQIVNIKHLSGLPLVQAIQDEDIEHGIVRLGADILSYLTYFGSLHAHRVVNCAWLAPVLSSMCYTADLLRRLQMGESTTTQRFLHEVSDFKKSAFELSESPDRRSQALRLCREAFEVTLDFVAACASGATLLEQNPATSWTQIPYVGGKLAFERAWSHEDGINSLRFGRIAPPGIVRNLLNRRGLQWDWAVGIRLVLPTVFLLYLYPQLKIQAGRPQEFRRFGRANISRAFQIRTRRRVSSPPAPASQEFKALSCWAERMIPLAFEHERATLLLEAAYSAATLHEFSALSGAPSMSPVKNPLARRWSPQNPAAAVVKAAWALWGGRSFSGLPSKD